MEGISSWILKSENSTHYIYKCPHCPEDKKRPTLYLDKGNGKFLCHRCGYKGIDTNSILYNAFCEKENKSFKNITFDVSRMNKITSSHDQYSYLINRGLTDKIIKQYDFRIYDKLFNNKAVVIHNGVDNNEITNYYQMRFIEATKGDFRYYNAKTNNKPLFGLQGIKGRKVLAICEGIFTSIGIQRIGVDSVCLLGKTLSSYQNTMLQNIVNQNNYSEIVVALDKDTNKETKNLSEYLFNNYDNKISAIILNQKEDYADQTIEDICSNIKNKININSNNLDMWEYLIKM